MGIQDSFGNFSKKLKDSISKAADSVKKSTGFNTSRNASSRNSSRGSSKNSSTGSSRPSGRTSAQPGRTSQQPNRAYTQSGGTRRSSAGAGLYSKAPAVPQRTKKAPAPKKPKKTDADRPAWLVMLRRIGRYAIRSVATVLLICIITGCIVGATAMVYVLAFLDKSITDVNLNQLKLNYTTTIYAYNSDSELVEYQTLHGNENRVWIDYSEITQYTKDAAVAVEDERFWKHHGVDWKSTLGAAANMFFQIYDSNRGGSTITQQLIKNVTKEDEVSVDRKLREIFKALELEKVYTKDQILESYLNVIALGSGCNGIQTAAQNYFGKDAKDLTLAESAAIVGITKYPSLYNPFMNPEKNRERQQYVLKKMLENGFITKAEYDEAIAEDYLSKLNVANKNKNTATTYWSWYTEQIFADVVRDLQERNGLTEAEARSQLYNGGLKIYANVDIELQKQAEAIFKNKTGKNTKYWTKFPRSVQPQCAVAILNYEGEIKAIVGGRGEKNANLLQNHASQSRRQPGSSIKPLTAYGPAVEFGAIEFSTPVTDKPMTITDNGKTRSWPRNSGNSYRGNIPVVKGLEVSANCVAARIVKYITPKKSYNFLTERLSIKLNEKDINLAPMATGSLTNGVTVLEMAAAYVPFGSKGIYYSPASYSLVTDQQGNTILENTSARGTRAMSEEAATIMNRMLRAPVTGSNGTARNAKIGSFDTFGKTGTTSDNKDRYFCGGTPYYVGACWFGYADNKKLEYTAKNYAMWAWKYVMQAAHKGLGKKDFSLSKNVVAKQYCTVTGGLASANCPSTATGYYDRNTNMPICPMHGGGTATNAFTALLSEKNAFETTTTAATEATTQADTTDPTTAPPTESE